MKLGLVTYLWGRDWDLPTMIANCEKTKVLGVELRTTHAHGVELSLSDAERKEVKKRFDDSPVVCVGPGSNERFCHPDPAALKKEYGDNMTLHGGMNVLLWDKPDELHAEIDRLVPVLMEGSGYIFASDHSIPSSLSLEEFRRIVEHAKRIGSYG